MPFNSIVTTFLILFFTSIINALPMESPAQVHEWRSSLCRFTTGSIVTNRGSFKVLRATSLDRFGKSDSNIIVEEFKKLGNARTWELANYKSEHKKWSAVDKVVATDENQDAAAIIVWNRVPELDSEFKKLNMDLAIVGGLGREKHNYHFDDDQWNQLVAYALVNPQEFTWKKNKGWHATPIGCPGGITRKRLTPPEATIIIRNYREYYYESFCKKPSNRSLSPASRLFVMHHMPASAPSD